MKSILNPDPKLVLQKTPSLYFGYATIFSCIVCIASFIWIFFDYDSIIALICTVSFIICFIICVFYAIISTRSRHLVNTTVNQQYPEKLDSSKTVHDAFILVHSMGNDGIISGLDNLIHSFKTKNYPFKIYHCYTPDDFKAVLANENAKYIWIFGHGWRGGITFKWKPSIWDIIHLKLRKQTNFRYSDLLENGQGNYPPKDFIAQFHCNHISKKEPSKTALPQILMNKNITPEMYHVSDYFNNHFSIWFTTRKLVKNIERKPFDSTDEQ
jgi:hypothetical protein